MNCKQIREAIDTASRRNPYSGAVASHLNDCPDCHRYSDETASLLGLLGAQPRVEAPPDFEFRLRARLLKAQAAPAIDARSFLRKIRPGTFSWGQTIAAAAALTMVVTVSTLYFNRDNRAPVSEGALTAHSSPAPRRGPAPEIKTQKAESVGEPSLKLTGKNLKVRLAPSQSESAEPPDNIAG
ncbi:MAG TPA: hypothetical protein VG324_16395, partial [Blastocatellia bacterium]|nr:hypothetical protein [Blastocatellia bacterium]